MQFNQDLDIHTYTIRSYKEGEITILSPLLEEQNPDSSSSEAVSKGLRQERLTQSLVIAPKRLIPDWRPQKAAELQSADLEPLLELKPEVVLLGTGARLEWPPQALFAPLIGAGIGYEVMDTAAACRTYNILSHEGRRVVAALMMI